MLRLKTSPLLLLLVSSLITNSSIGREWTSASGGFKIEAEAVSFNDELVVLKKSTGELIAVELKELSSVDQEFIKSKEATDAEKNSAESMQTWTAKDGMKVRGRVLAYGRKELRILRKQGHVVINETQFSMLDPLHQRLILRIVSELEKTRFESEKQLEEWAKKSGGNPKTYMLEGVLLELESGDEIGVPFFLFAPEELAILEPGLELWKERAESDESRSRESFLVRSAAMAYQRDRAANKQIEMVKLNMLGAVAGVTAIWQVGLAPGRGTYGRPTTVMVAAQNSDIASRMAMQQYPGYVLVGVSRASR